MGRCWMGVDCVAREFEKGGLREEIERVRERRRVRRVESSERRAGRVGEERKSEGGAEDGLWKEDVVSGWFPETITRLIKATAKVP